MPAALRHDPKSDLLFAPANRYRARKAVDEVVADVVEVAVGGEEEEAAHEEGGGVEVAFVAVLSPGVPPAGGTVCGGIAARGDLPGEGCACPGAAAGSCRVLSTSAPGVDEIPGGRARSSAAAGGDEAPAAATSLQLGQVVSPWLVLLHRPQACKKRQFASLQPFGALKA